jgi:hypothetical protein
MAPIRLDELARRVAGLDRESCKEHLRDLSPLRLDFTEEYLETLSVDRLRHVVMAAMMQAMKRDQRAAG